MPADTTYIQMPADCPDQQTIVKDGGKEISVVIKDKIIYIKRITPADSIAIYNTLFKKNVKEVKQEIKVVEKTAFKTPKFMIWLLIVSISINILFVLYYGLKKRFMIG
jgi:flagellar biosynthesis/type III secretory pathway M-ring protein FliF/YscJ